MLVRKEFVFLFHLIFVILTGCTIPQAVATNENGLLTTESTLVSATSTPNPTCVDNPEIKPDNLATLEFPNSLSTIESGVDIPSFWDSPQIKDGLTFNVRGIYAINKDMVFVFGGFQVPGGIIGSLLLRSTDGGIHWKEVLNPIDHHVITHIVFVGKGEGWAIATWQLEGEGGGRLWHTIDYGETWQENKGHLPSGFGIKVFDSKHMQIKFLDWWANPNTDRYMIWDSDDGGTTWAESFSIPVNDANVDAVVEAYADTPGGSYGNYYRCEVWKTACIAYGQDGSKWQIQSIYSKTCIPETGAYYDRLAYVEINRVWLENETSVAIPVYFYYQDNRIYVKP